MPSGDDGYYQYVPTNEKSPATYTSFSVSNTTLVRAYMKNSTRNANYGATLSYDKITGKIYGSVSRRNDEGNARAYIVITKIEVYS